jgi:death-on-curing family protein
MKPRNKKWIPTPEFILHVFQELGKIPECNDISNAICRDITGIIGVIDKINYGWPGTQNPSIQECAATLIHDIVVYHYFSDGNKRIGFIIFLIFLEKNGYSIIASEDEKVEFTLSIAQDIPSFEEIQEWITRHWKKY